MGYQGRIRKVLEAEYAKLHTPQQDNEFIHDLTDPETHKMSCGCYSDDPIYCAVIKTGQSQYELDARCDCPHHLAFQEHHLTLREGSPETIWFTDREGNVI